MSPTSLGREHPPPTLTADKFIKFTSDHTIPEGLVSRMPDTLSAVGGGEHLHHRLQKIHCQPQRPTSTPAYGQAQADRQRLCTEPATGLPGCSALGVHLIQAGTPSPPITGDTDMLQQPLQQQTKIFSVTVLYAVLRSTQRVRAGILVVRGLGFRAGHMPPRATKKATTNRALAGEIAHGPRSPPTLT